MTTVGHWLANLSQTKEPDGQHQTVLLLKLKERDNDIGRHFRTHSRCSWIAHGLLTWKASCAVPLLGQYFASQHRQTKGGPTSLSGRQSWESCPQRQLPSRLFTRVDLIRVTGIRERCSGVIDGRRTKPGHQKYIVNIVMPCGATSHDSMRALHARKAFGPNKFS
jgi:hypothetical protein